MMFDNGELKYKRIIDFVCNNKLQSQNEFLVIDRTGSSSNNKLLEVSCNSEKYFIKYFKRLQNIENEIKGHDMASIQNLSSYNLIYSSIPNESEFFIIMSEIPGYNGMKSFNSCSSENIKLSMFEEIGCWLGKMHRNKIEAPPGHKMRLKNRIDYIYDELEKKYIPQDDFIVLKEAYKMLVKNYDNVHFEDINFAYGHGDFDFRNVNFLDNKLTGAFDFELSGYTNTELDLLQLEKKYFKNNNEYSKAFFKGYNIYSKSSKLYRERKHIYLIMEILNTCRWSFLENQNIFKENINFLLQYL